MQEVCYMDLLIVHRRHSLKSHNANYSDYRSALIGAIRATGAVSWCIRPPGLQNSCIAERLRSTALALLCTHRHSDHDRSWPANQLR